MRLASALAALERNPRIVLAALVVVQWIAVAAFASTVPHNGWLFYQGGDQTFVYTTAWELGGGHLPLTEIGYGWSLVLAPITVLAGPNFLVALPWILVLQFAVLLPAALLAVYGIAEGLGGRLLGYAAATLWVVVPYAAIALFVDRYHPQFAEQFLPQALGLSGLSDFPSMVALLVAAYLTLRALDAGDPRLAVLGGLTTGFAIGIKPSNVLFLAAPALAFAATRRFRVGGGFAAGLALPLLALLVWKARGLGEVPLLAWQGTPVALGSTAAATEPIPLLSGLDDYVRVDWHRLRAQRDGLQEFFWSIRLLEFLPLAGAVAVARRSVPKALFLAVWLALYFVFKGSAQAASVSSGSFFRLLMPAFPAFFLLAVSLPLLLPTYGPRLTQRAAAAHGRTPRIALVVAAAALLGLVPAGIAATLPPRDAPQAVKHFETSLFVPVAQDFSLDAVVANGSVRLGWHELGSAGADVHYRILRSPYRYEGRAATLPRAVEGIQCVGDDTGAPDCSLEMTPVGVTRATSWRDEPPPGRWTYRVALIAAWTRAADQADLVLVGRPATVTVGGPG